MTGSTLGLASTHTKACFGLMNLLSFSAEQSGGRGRREGEVAGELWEGVSTSQPDCLNSPPEWWSGRAGSHRGIPTQEGFPLPALTGAAFRQIWDTAGQERFRSVTHAYYRDAQALLLLYDITSKMSFDNIRAWLTEIHEYAQKDVVIMLLGNKADVSSERAVRTEDGASLAREYGVPFMETSAKTGMNVELAFLAIAKELKQRAVQPPDEPRFQIHDYIESQKKKSSCCAFA
ncbi:ras-related protein Rab-37 isoform 1-T1 [Morphnus guianensis]